MSDTFIASSIFQWLLLIICSFAVINLYIQRRMFRRELGMKDAGFAYGTVFPKLRLQTFLGEDVSLSSKNIKGSVVAFTAVSCDACNTLYPSISSFLKSRPGFQMTIMMVGNAEDVSQKAAHYDISVPVVRLQHEQLEEFGVKGFPFAYYLSPEGKVLSKGIVNSGEHLSILIGSAYANKGKAS
ncbi:TlpA family protein disulfide reductase [Paenibacillus sp. MBLB4367]|uniref:TlpA family protein disulfide reductase n=1 Tax=Paenibacillus sp. MBLB4367 TaxID=3384767 RepID=UPI003908271E